MPLAERDGQKIVLFAEHRDRELVRQVPGARWDKDRQAWTLALTWGGCVQLRGVFGSALEVGPELAQWSRLWKQNVVDSCLELRLMLELPVDHPFSRRLDELGL